MRRSTRLHVVLAPVVAAATTLLLAGCLQIGPPTQTQEPTSQPTAETSDPEDTPTTDEGETVGVFTLAVGDCLLDPGTSDSVTETTVIDCDSEHNYEVFDSSTVADGDFPGDEAINAQAETDCDAAFESFIGVPYADSVYYLNFFVPTEGSWEQGDREILCLVADPTGSNTGTLQGANE